MPVAHWIDRLADDIATTVAIVRPLLRRLHYDPPPIGTVLRTPASNTGQAITIGANEARTLLRAAQPVPQASRALRPAHARLLAALSTAADLMLTANDPIGGDALAITAVLELRDALTAWLASTRWKQATTAAGVAWAAPIITVTRRSTGARREHHKNARPGAQLELLLPLPGRAAAPRAPTAALRRAS